MKEQAVAVGLVFNDVGEILIHERPLGKPYAGYWEFPGGKVEIGEAPQAALARELHEEIGIDVQESRRMAVLRYRYPDKIVVLQLYRVIRYQGTPHGREAQTIAWVTLDQLAQAPLLAANASIVRLLHLPKQIWITPEQAFAEVQAELEERVQAGIRLVIWRAKHLDPIQYFSQAKILVAQAHACEAKVLLHLGQVCTRGQHVAHPTRVLSSRAQSRDLTFKKTVVTARQQLAQTGADGYHIPSYLLPRLAANGDEVRSQLLSDDRQQYMSTACHNAEELALSARIQADFALLSPVFATPSHPDALPLGWPAFAAMVADAMMPVYALGGVSRDMLTEAEANGAYGVTSIRF